MNRRRLAPCALPICLLFSHCADPGAGEDAVRGARIDTQLSAATAADRGVIEKFRAGAATARGLESLKYQIDTIEICEALEVEGSAFRNPTNCLELYRHENPALAYGLNDDWTPLVERARQSDEGFIDL